MIKLLVLIIYVLIFTTACFCQAKRELDWQDIKTTLSTAGLAEPVTWGQFTVFQIKEINKFLYRVEIAGKSFELQTPIPSELQTLFRLSPAELNKTAKNVKAEDAVDQSTEGIGKISKRSLQMRVGDPAEEGPVEQALEELNTKYQQYLEAVKAISTDILFTKKIRNQLIAISQKDASYSAISSEVAALGWTPRAIEARYSDLKELYDQVNLKVEILKGLAKEDDPETLAIANAVSKNLKNADALINEESLLSLIDDVEYLNAELQNAKNFIITAPPVQMDGDLISYDVTITPSTTKTLSPYRNPMQFKFDVPAKGGVKVDFSVGPTASFGSSAKDEVYFLGETDNDDEGILKKRTNNNSLTPGIGAFLHCYVRSGKFAAVGGLFGIGAGFQSTSDPNFSLYIGPTIVLGKAQKIMINGGVSYLKVQRLKKEEFEVNKSYTKSDFNIDDVSERVFRPSIFLGLSYNLTNRVEISH